MNNFVITPDTDIRLLMCPLEIDRLNQLEFSTENAQYNYFNSLPSIEVENATFQRHDQSIRFPECIDNILPYNYVMYKNTHYSDKWFYAFINRMEYVNTNCTAIYIETDAFQTYQFDIVYKPSFIEREHVNNDTVGIHTLPENVELGEYICNSHTKDTTMDSYSQDLCYVMASTSLPLTGEASTTVAPSAKYNGIYTGLSYYRYDQESAIDTILELFATNGKTEAINGIFMAPKWLAPLSGDVLRSVEQSDNPLSFTTSITKQRSLNGYTPKNNKLLCFPYNYLLVSNNIGQNSILHYEKFSGSNASFIVRGVLNPGCSINITPTNYNGCEYNDNEAIQIGKFPICNFQNDMYTNWLTQNSINILGQTITTDDVNLANNVFSGGASLATSILTGGAIGPQGTASGLFGIANALIQKKQHRMIPATVEGQLNSADINVASGNNTIHYYKMSIRQEYAKIIDDYFSAYGYEVDDIKLPNLTGRQNWNFVKTVNCNIEGDIPQAAIEEIKSMFNKGLTLWHNPNTFMDYSQPNNII